MAQTVRCDVCGKLFSSSYLGAHKRLAHASTEEEVARQHRAASKKILDLFKALPANTQKKILSELSALVASGG